MADYDAFRAYRLPLIYAGMAGVTSRRTIVESAYSYMPGKPVLDGTYAPPAIRRESDPVD